MTLADFVTTSKAFISNNVDFSALLNSAMNASVSDLILYGVLCVIGYKVGFRSLTAGTRFAGLGAFSILKSVIALFPSGNSVRRLGHATATVLGLAATSYAWNWNPQIALAVGGAGFTIFNTVAWIRTFNEGRT